MIYHWKKGNFISVFVFYCTVLWWVPAILLCTVSAWLCCCINSVSSSRMKVHVKYTVMYFKKHDKVTNTPSFKIFLRGSWAMLWINDTCNNWNKKKENVLCVLRPSVLILAGYVWQWTMHVQKASRVMRLYKTWILD